MQVGLPIHDEYIASNPIDIIKHQIEKNNYSSEYPPGPESPLKEDMFNKLIRDRLLHGKLLIHDNFYKIYQLSPK